MPADIKTIDDFFIDGQLKVEALSDLPKDPGALPVGWMTPLELKLLYNLGRYGQDDFLEIGSYVGRSTVAIALGFRDAGAHSNRRLDVNDFGFVSLEEACDALHVGPDSFQEDHLLRSIHGTGGIVGCLIENLRVHGLIKQVTSIIRGNAAEVPLRESYGVVFCDATHTEREIAVVGPVLRRVLRPGSWLMCDDIHDNAELVKTLEEYVSFEFFFRLSEIDVSQKAAVGKVKAR